MMAENALFGGGASIPYPTYQPPTNPLTQMQSGIGVMQGLQGLQGQQIQQQQQQLELGQKRMFMVHDQLGAIAALENPTIDDVKQAASTLYRAGIPQDQITQALQTVPRDPQAIKAWAQQHMAGIADFQQRMGLGSEVPVQLNQGGKVLFGTRSLQQPGKVTLPGATQSVGGTSIPMTNTPEFLGTPEEVRDQFGNVTQTTRGGALAAKGFSPATSQPFQNAFGKPAATSQPQGLPGMGAGFEPNFKAYNEDVAAAQPLARVVRDSSLALNLAERLGTTGTGPGTKVINDVRATMESLGITAPNDLVSMRNELDKYLARGITNSPMAQRSDMATIATKLSEPNTETQTNQATRDLLKSKIAQTGMDIATPYAYNGTQYGGTINGYLTHKGQFTQSQDQQAYALAQGLMPQDQAKSLLDKMFALPADSAAKKKFFDSLANAKKAGLYNLPGATTNAQGQ